MGAKVWLLVHGEADFQHPLGLIEEPLRLAYFGHREELRGCDHAVLVVDSYGGDAKAAYQIAMLFRRHCGGFVSVIPRVAKSAATLLALGGEQLFLGHDAELGPLDAQIGDVEREEVTSALDEVQALERLNSAGLDQIDQTMFLLLQRTHKKIDSLLPIVLHYVAELMEPLLAKIDTVHYTQRARVLKVAEDYATRLLLPKYSRPAEPGSRQKLAEKIAGKLVNSYPEHDFVIDREELRDLELDLPEPDDAIAKAIDSLEEWLTFNPTLAIGRIQEVTDHAG